MPTGGFKYTQRSTDGYLIAINEAVIFWRIRRQTVIVLFSAGSKYVALPECAKTVSWMRKLCWEVSHQEQWSEDIVCLSTDVAMGCTTAQALATNEQVSGRSKHIDLKVNHVKESVRKKVIHLFHVTSRSQPADNITKTVEINTFRQFVYLLRLSDS